MANYQELATKKTYEIGALQGGIVLTGGGSKIRNIDQTIRELMGENYRKSSLVSLDYFRDVPEEIKKILLISQYLASLKDIVLT